LHKLSSSWSTSVLHCVIQECKHKYNCSHDEVWWSLGLSSCHRWTNVLLWPGCGLLICRQHLMFMVTKNTAELARQAAVCSW
jgi:hypothetical protein